MNHYLGMIAENVTFGAHNADVGEAYYVRPSGPGPFPGVVIIHHMPAWDEGTIEATRKLAHNGFLAISPHLYFRYGQGAPDDVAARGRAAGGLSDDEVMGDVAGAIAFIRAQKESNGKVAVMGFCSGGRHAFLAACLVDTVDAAVDCYGGYVIVDDPAKQITPQRPVAPIDLADKMKAPLLGIFGNNDKNPDRAQVDETEKRLKDLGKEYEFHRYDDASHAFFSTDRKSFRPEQTKDAWSKIFAFLQKHLAS
jgi:carboxymethylenebutenolidase